MEEMILPNGYTLYWKDNGIGGRTYYSDEIGNGILVWDTCLVDMSTLTEAINRETELKYEERRSSLKFKGKNLD